MEMTNFFNDSELVALNAQEMETIEGGGIIKRFLSYASAFMDAFIDVFLN
jgi:hypothetical protein